MGLTSTDSSYWQKDNKAEWSTTSIVAGLYNSPLELNAFKIYPNPSSDILHVSFSNTLQIYNIHIVNSNSETIYSTLSSSNQHIDLATFPKGLYFVQILNNSNNKVENKRLLIE